ncbi:NAD-glutamate dehydrogenase domain-containing protein [Nitrosophilus alvini]|uniref:NAD-glutamate dehydrogenase domain-containing protein n=1 Tax=Nitrosophilus alvini TaxID=2714855 RepID=UPI0019097442|nr:NAD-glutamate dehydrogenase domain-containing protein [Nitrosophilus alvini]
MKPKSNIEKACSEIFATEDLLLDEKIFETVEKDKPKALFVYEKETTYLKIFSKERIHISHIIPLLHDIGFEVIDEVSFSISKKGETFFVNRFKILTDTEKLEKSEKNVIEIIEKTLSMELFKHCRLYAFALKENMSISEILLLKALLSYENQIVLEFNEAVILKTFLKHHSLIKDMVVFFKLMFQPNIDKRAQKIKEQKKRIEESLKNIDHITEDKILKILYKIITHMLRTNYFLQKEYISFKIDIKALEEYLLGIQPSIEAFVFHRNFHGIHLRMGPVSRGGIRWSDRFEDYREEIKSLMSTQEAKNAIIVPSGAKGGFVIFKENASLTKKEFKNIYSMFIEGLLDLIDNKKDSQIIKNPDVISYDKEDFYFVVAPDKGTSAMSDTANEIALKRGFWLKDAFASGGSKGYNHKKLGVTAKGAWKSAQRHFMKKGIDIYKDSISVVGTGSMRGDVFGNAMLINPNIKLLAAISGDEIFIDPAPDTKTAFKERKRLFEEKKGWSDYDRKKISKGGGVFKKSAKKISLSEEIRKMLKISKESISGEELIKRVLCLKVDMLFIGGIGTYVKSSDEINLYLPDKENENYRVDASDLKAFSVCEGGNLGFTMKARIEYARKGGAINLDSIDNSAGVDTSDHEVNLKIVLNELQNKGVIDEKERIETLFHLTDNVLNSVYWNNYLQSLAITLDEIRSQYDRKSFIKTIEILEENIKIFKRRDFSIPKTNDFDTVVTKNGTIARPVLGILLSYSKIFLKQVLLKSDFLDTPFSKHYLYKYFPKPFASVYEKEISSHPLYREITATVIANKIINHRGSSFIADYDVLGEKKFIEKIKSYLIVNRLLGINDIRYEIFRSDFEVPARLQYKLLLNIENSIDFSVEWMLKNFKTPEFEPSNILSYTKEIKELMESAEKEINITQFIKNRPKINLFFSLLDYLKFIVAVIYIKEDSSYTFKDIATLFMKILTRFKIVEILEIIGSFKPATEKEKAVKKQLQYLLEFFVTRITKKCFPYAGTTVSLEDALERYIESKELEFEKIFTEIEKFTDSSNQSLPYLTYIVNILVLSVI